MLAALGDTLAVAFHVALLEVGGEAMQILIVGQEGGGLCAIKVRVPNAQQSENDWSLRTKGREKVTSRKLMKVTSSYVLFQRSGLEMLIDEETAFLQLLKVIESN